MVDTLRNLNTNNMSDIQLNSQLKMEDPVKTSDSSAEGTVTATDGVQTPTETRSPAEVDMRERGASLSTQIATYSTKEALDVGVPDGCLQTKRKSGNADAQSISSEGSSDITRHESENSIMLGHACTGLNTTSKTAQKKTRGERRDERAFSGSIDPEYARILSSVTFDTTHGRDRSRSTAFSQSPVVGIERNDPLVSSDASDDVAEILRGWDRKYRRNGDYNMKLLGDSKDSAYKSILSSEAALASLNVSFGSQQVSTVKPDKEYGHILRRHDFSFHNLSPAKDLVCLDCNIYKPVSQYPGDRQICNDCHLQDSAAEDFVVEGSYEGADTSYLNQYMEEEPSTTSGSMVLPARKKSRPRESRPLGFIDSKDILRSLNKPEDSRKATLKRKPVQSDEAIRLYEDVARRDQQAYQKKQRMEPSYAKPPSLESYSFSPIEPNGQLVRLGIKTMSADIPIWLKVSRSAPLGDMFVTALQSDEALRSHVFMLPDQFVRWDDTPDKLNLKDDDRFEMHELPKTWLSNIKCTTNIDAAETPSVQETPEHELSRSSGRLRFDGRLDYRSSKVRNTRKVVYDVKIPKPIDINNVASSISYPQYSSSSDSETSKFSLPKVSAETEAELLAILAASEESTPSHTSISEQSHSPLLQPQPEIQSMNISPEPGISTSRSPSVIFLHESKGPVSPQEDTELQQIKTNVKRLLEQYPSPEREAKRPKR